MNFSHFFIRRPIFAGVLSALIFIIGLIAMWRLPISEYPEVVPPTIVVQATYPGANPKTISETVAAPLEQVINGVENSLYMFSQATSDGVMALTVTFKLGTDIDKAQVQVQNRVAQALPKLPEEVRQLGVITTKQSPDLTMVVHLFSPNNRYDEIYLRNYATLQVKDVLARIPGAGSVQLFGSGDYAMRVWLDPNKIAAKGLTASDVVAAIREQNVQVAAGGVGQQPVSQPVALELQVNAKGRLIDEEEFGQIIVKTGENGEKTLLKDVARVELGAAGYSLRSLLNNKTAVAIPVFQMPGANAIQLSKDVRRTMQELKQNFPEGLDYSVVYDPTVFVRHSTEAVVHTLFEAILLVVLVVILFLQTWRASIIPLAAVPVSLVGTFAVMLAFGFSINALSLFGLVLAIGIVVDDSIVVVENVERNTRTRSRARWTNCSAGFSGRSIGSLPGRETIIPPASAPSSAKAPLRWSSMPDWCCSPAGASTTCQPASCPRKISNTWSPSRSCPTGLRSTAPRRSSAGCRTLASNNPACRTRWLSPV